MGKPICFNIVYKQYQITIAWLAQLVERTAFNRVVVGSSPTSGT